MNIIQNPFMWLSLAMLKKMAYLRIFCQYHGQYFSESIVYEPSSFDTLFFFYQYIKNVWSGLFKRA